MEEFGDPYKISKDKKIKKVKSDKVEQIDETTLPDLLSTLNEYLSPEDQFSLYISNKELQEALNQQYRKNKKQDFIPWLRNYLKNQHVKHLEELERERIAKNKEAKLEKQRLKKVNAEIKREEQQEFKQRKRQEILEDERRAKENYERQEAQRRMYNQFYQPKQESVLQRLGINDRNQYRIWILRNHPDKGGQNDIFALVLDEAKRQGW